eukprot:g48164.t1
MAGSSLKALLFCFLFVSTSLAKLSVVGTTCSNNQCMQGYNCQCDCDKGKGVVFLYGGCMYCSPSTCENSLGTICSPGGVQSHRCDVNCESNTMVADGSCQTIRRSDSGKQWSYYLTCEGNNYYGSIGNNCSKESQRSFTGDSRYCYSPQNIDLLGFNIDCKHGISTGGIIGIIIGCLAACLLCTWCIFSDEFPELCNNCECSCKPRKELQRVASLPSNPAPVVSPSGGDGAAAPQPEQSVS